MIETKEYYGGTYPEPKEVIDDVDNDYDYEDYYADEYYELDVLGLLE